MSRVADLIGGLADSSNSPDKAGGVRMLISLNIRSNNRLVALAQVLDVPTGVLASRLLAVALLDAEERASDLDLYDRS